MIEFASLHTFWCEASIAKIITNIFLYFKREETVFRKF